MTKTKKNTRAKRNEYEGFWAKFNVSNIIPEKYHTLAAILVIVLLFLIYFAPMYFGGKTYQSGDLLTSMSFKNYVAKHSEHLWNPYIFCGMPSAMSFGPDRWYDFTAEVYNIVRQLPGRIFSVSYSSVTFYLFILAIGMLILMRVLKANIWISLFVALSTAFSTGLIVFVFIGHVTQIAVVAIFPFLFLFLFRLQKKIKLLDILLLIITIHFLFEPFHVQVIFYTFFALLIYFIYYIIHYIYIKDFKQLIQILKSGLILFVAIIIALLMSYDKYMQTYEYTPYSTRGAKSVLEGTGKQKSESDFYKYATDWSFSPGEMMTFIIPSYYGFGNSTYNGPLTHNEDYKINTYFGQMPFVDVAMYMGVIIFFLGLFSIYANWKNPFIRYLTILIIISLLISFGRTFPPVYDLMFYHFPFFDKFRVPSMILILVQLSFPILAGFGLMKIIKLREEKELKYEKIIKNVTLIFAGIFILSFILGGPISDWFKERIANSGQRGQQLNPLYDYMSDMFLTDMHIAFFLLTAVFGLSLLYIKNRISADTLILSIILFSLIDLWRIDYRGGSYVNSPEIKNIFDKPDYVKEIEKQNDQQPFRILNIKQDGTPGSLNSNQNYYVYFLLEDFYGYSGIKPRTYQDFMDVDGPINPTLWRMLNVKYIISEKPTNIPGLQVLYQNSKSTLSINKYALPRAYFVDAVKSTEPLKFLNMIKNNQFDPGKTAYLENQKLNVDAPDSSASVKIVEYKDEHISIDAKATGNNFLFLGDTYYPPGWKVTIDGKKVKVYKTDHGFMGLIVPKGMHKIDFIYAPASFYTGKYISLAINTILLLILFLMAIIFLKNRKKLGV